MEAIATTGLIEGMNPRTDADALLETVRSGGRAVLRDLFSAEEYQRYEQRVVETGVITTHSASGKSRDMYIQTRPIPGTNDHEVLSIAAVSRDPGRAQSAIDLIQDFRNATAKQRQQEVDQLWNIYGAEGIISTAINKVAAIMSAGGSFKVRAAKKGKVRKAVDELQGILDDFKKNVNANPVDGVVTGSRGLQAVNHQAVRFALVEGSWIGRTVWGKKRIMVNGKQGAYSVPINIQSISSGQVEPVKELVGTGIELFYWKPSQDILKLLDKTDDKNVKNAITKFIPKELQGPLKKDKKVLLDPALLMHIKHRGVDTQPFGQSFIKPAYSGIRYKRAVEALDLVSMENLINRLTIIMVGSDDPKSPYAKAEAQQARTAMMQKLLADPGPNMTIIWQGPDVKVEDIGAHSAVLDLDERHKIADGKVKIALGVPDALLSGTTSDGKAAGWAAMLGAASELVELQNALANAWTTIGERIAMENGFEDVEIVFEFDNALMVDRTQEWDQLRQDAIAGLISIRTFLEGRGYDYKAEYIQRCLEKGLDPDPENPETTYEKIFTPIMGLPGQGTSGAPPGQGGGNVNPQGRPKGGTNDVPPEKKPSSTENK